MAETVVVHPLPITVVRAYLLTRTEITDEVESRVSTQMPAASVSPRFPALRLSPLSSVEIIPRVWARVLMQVDCWADTQPEADQLGEIVRGVLRASANHTTTVAVMGETEDLVVRHNEPDTTLTPAQPRSIVTGHCWIRPN